MTALPPEKLPARSAAVSGEALVPSAAGRIRSPSYEPKMNSLFLRIGPPAAAPNWFWISCGFYRRRKERARVQILIAQKLPRAPCNWLVPDFVTTLKTAPAFRPYSAEKLLVSTFTSCSASGGG